MSVGRRSRPLPQDQSAWGGRADPQPSRNAGGATGRDVTPRPLSSLPDWYQPGWQQDRWRRGGGALDVVLTLIAAVTSLGRFVAAFGRETPPPTGGAEDQLQGTLGTPAQGAPISRWWIGGMVVLVVLAVVAGMLLRGLPRLPTIPGRPLAQMGRAPLPRPPLAPGVSATDVPPAITVADLIRAALPMGLGAFWLLVAWLLDAEARRAFVRREPWGDRLTGPYSCLAVGCLAPLILCGLLFGAWGYVSFVLWLARLQGWANALRAGGAIFALLLLVLWGRSLLVHWWTSRGQP